MKLRPHLFFLFCVACASLFVSDRAAASDTSQPGAAPAVERRVLHVSIYPYVPDAVGVAYAIKQGFEAENPDIVLQLSMNANYYDYRPEKGGVFYESADVYEMDSVFLADFVGAGKIRALPPTLFDAVNSTIPIARAAATNNGTLFGVPHWVCGNFLIYRAGDSGIATAHKLPDLEKAFGATPGLQKGLLLDLKGSSTIGEMYLDSLMDHYGTRDAALIHIDPSAPDSYPGNAMKRALALEAAGFGRDSDYHYTTGFYARQFARGNGRALVGYSEELYYALSESGQSCRKDENCIKQSDIRVTDWPLADEGSHPIAWVDMFVIDVRTTRQKQADAEKFIKFMVRKETYKMLLIPPEGDAPRYLLPAREDVYSDPDIEKAAPLYSEFRHHIDSATPITEKGLNRRLREIGSLLDSSLPSH